jgi:hypothetical protein
MIWRPASTTLSRGGRELGLGAEERRPIGTPGVSEWGQVRDGDVIELDIPGRPLTLQVSGEELDRRRAAWRRPSPRYARDYGRLFSEHVSQANEECDCDFLERGAARRRRTRKSNRAG